MNQRIKKYKNRRRHQDIDGMTISTGSHVARHSLDEDPIVRIPPKVTGDIPTKDDKAGFAKASPRFKQLKELKPDSKAEEKRVIAEATEKVVDRDEEDEVIE